MEESVTIKRETYDDFMRQAAAIKAIENKLPVSRAENTFNGSIYYNVDQDVINELKTLKLNHEKKAEHLESMIEEMAKLLDLHTANRPNEQNIVTQIDLDRAKVKVSSSLFDRIANYMWKRK